VPQLPSPGRQLRHGRGAVVVAGLRGGGQGQQRRPAACHMPAMPLPYARGVRFDAATAGSRRRLVPALVVLAAHALLLALWLQTRAPLSPVAAGTEAVAWLRLLESAAPAAGPAEPAEPGTARQRTARPSIVRPITPSAVTASPTVPMAAEPPATAGHGAPPSAAAAAPAASGAAPVTLDLTLPRQPQAPWRERNPALDDPRSNTRPPAAVEARIAAALGDGRWQVERLDHDRVRYRSGSLCVIATRSRAGQLELAGGAFRELWAVSDC
jgi:hypothetical protein